ncbi:MAG: aminomethyl-transferring glycine dehydrogenase subunit GcvPB [Deltaproteobacteria bacterium]|nr:aminomethyl-transferring glycine dehydrogenase subunit GcvPB [Deltaproteobacteria bacterium]
MGLIFDKSVTGRRGVTPPKGDVPTKGRIPEAYLRAAPAELPELSELDVVRHFTALSKKNFGVDGNFYPLGSCTMKYNPKFLEEVAGLDGFAQLHPLLPQLRRGGMLTQGALEVIYELSQLLAEITGMDQFTTQPLAGAHGELTGMMIIAAYHKHKGNHKTKVLVPDAAHGTNPASAAIAGYEVVSVPSDDQGGMDLAKFERALDQDTAAVLLTCPNTLGLFDRNVAKIAEMTHQVDGLMYYDGANLNAILGRLRPGDLGFDVIHLNLHKTFATPHGGGGPGAGPVGVKAHLAPYLPVSLVIKRDDGTYALEYDRPLSVGYIAPFYGNFGVLVKAYAYVLALGREGLRRVSENAVLNANYLMHKLKKYYDLPYDRTCMHEFVLSAKNLANKGASALDIAKALIDFGFHPPTVYFPLIVKEALMIEPTETESKETLDLFADIMIDIVSRLDREPGWVKQAPFAAPVSRLDEVAAVKNQDFASI